MDGLRDDIWVVVTLQHPSSLDTAYSLALLQEEVTDSAHKPDWHKSGFKGNSRTALPLPRAPVEKPVADKTLVVPPDDKLSALRANRRARGSASAALRSGSAGTSALPLFSCKQFRRYGISSIWTAHLTWQKKKLVNSCWLYLMMHEWGCKVTGQSVSMVLCWTNQLWC